MTLVLALTNLMLLTCGVLFFLLPEMSRPGTFFGVTVSNEFPESPQGRRILRRFRRRIALAAFTVVALSNAGLMVSMSVFPIAILILGIASVVFWIYASKEARGFAQRVGTVRTASLTPRSSSLPGGWLFFCGPFLILALAAWYLQANWDQIPGEFPIHWSLDGRPNGWAHRSFFGVFGLLLIGTLSSILTGSIAAAIMLGTRTVSPTSDAAAGDRTFKRATYFFIVGISYLVSLTFAMVSTRPVWAGALRGTSPAVLPVLVIVPLALVSTIYLARVSRSRRGNTGDGTPDACWKWGGLIYYNPEDPAFLVEKRMGIGWTFNFANKWSWVALACTLLPAVLIVVVVKLGVR